VIHHIDLNCPDCKAYWLDREYKDKTLPETFNKISNLTEFLFQNRGAIKIMNKAAYLISGIIEPVL
jgi:Zn-finger nucleic acid-binding protein